MAHTQKRVFRRINSDGTENVITTTWEDNKPTASFKLESTGYSGTRCLTELKGIEDVIGASQITEKAEMYDGEDPQNVFIVGQV
jgi:hypothetical protein